MTEKNERPMRIIGLKAENVKRLKAVSLDTNRTLIKVEGKNAAGKSSLLDAIMYAFGGGKVLPDMPIRKGETKARVVIDLDEITIERRWTLKGTSLIVTTKDGVPQSSPQAILDKLTGDLMFDPLKFADMSPSEQSVILKKLAGLDFTSLDKRRDEYYAERTIVNREVKNAEANVCSPVEKPVNTTLVSIRDLAEEQQEANTHNRKIDGIESTIGVAKSIVSALSEEIEQAQKKIKMHDEVIVDNENLLKSMERIDTGDINEKILKAEDDNWYIESYDKYVTARSLAITKQTESELLTKQIEDIDGEKARLLLAAKFPLDGIGIDENGPTLDGIPFSQASLSQRLRTGVAIGLAEKKRARIVLIHDGSLLDKDSMKDLNEILEEYDAQCFVEIVSDTASESAVYIEDGELLETSK